MGTRSNAGVRPLRRRNFLIAKGTMNTIRSVERRDRRPGRGREWRSRQGSAEIPRRKRCSVTRSALGGEPVEHIQHNIAEDMSHMTKSGIAILCLPYVRPGASTPKANYAFSPISDLPLCLRTRLEVYEFFSQLTFLKTILHFIHQNFPWPFLSHLFETNLEYLPTYFYRIDTFPPILVKTLFTLYFFLTFSPVHFR